MEQYYYVDANNQRQGPVYPSEFRNCGVTAETLVWKAGMENWAKASTLPELAMWLDVPVPPVGEPVVPEVPKEPQNESAEKAAWEPMPDNYLVWAILSTILCCLPFGIVSIVKSTQVEKLWLMGEKERAYKASEDAKKWAIIGAVVSVVGGLLYGMFLLIVSLVN